MCGIAGIFAYSDNAPNVDRSSLDRIHQHLARRGPDGEGMWMAPAGRVALAHRRLAIIDLSPLAAQPMADPEQQHVISFNGEIYNYKHLRQSLEAKGYVFRSHSDTEVLLHLYRDRGPAMLQELRGMFAFAIWDEAKKGLFLARDPYGIKPLYYSDDGKTLRFASQVKALLAGGGINTAADEAGWAGFYLFGSVPEPYTIYQGIKSLEAGSSLRVGRNGCADTKNFYSIAKAWSGRDEKPPQWTQDSPGEIREALKESVRKHLVSDVPVGCFLSAGVDSSALLGLMSECSTRQIQTITLAFSEFTGRHDDESILAARTAQHYGSHHTTRRVTEDEFHQDLPAILAAMDQPSIDGINTWFISKAAAESGLKVAISGLGGDELFAGYPSFRCIPSWVRLCALPAHIPGFGVLLRTLTQNLSCLNPKAPGMLEYGGSYAGAYLLKRALFMPWELTNCLESNMGKMGLKKLQPVTFLHRQLGPYTLNARAKIATLESVQYLKNQLLRDADWAGMAHGLEIRTPLVDSVLLSQIAPLLSAAPTGQAKQWLATAPIKALPDSLLSRPKTGFQTPIGLWQTNLDQNRWPIPVSFHKRWHWARHWALKIGVEFRP